jgi:hypothetical protein
MLFYLLGEFKMSREKHMMSHYESGDPFFLPTRYWESDDLHDPETLRHPNINVRCRMGTVKRIGLEESGGDLLHYGPFSTFLVLFHERRKPIRIKCWEAGEIKDDLWCLDNEAKSILALTKPGDFLQLRVHKLMENGKPFIVRRILCNLTLDEEQQRLAEQEHLGEVALTQMKEMSQFLNKELAKKS